LQGVVNIVKAGWLAHDNENRVPRSVSIDNEILQKVECKVVGRLIVSRGSNRIEGSEDMAALANLPTTVFSAVVAVLFWNA
jgi:hypothetical protein